MKVFSNLSKTARVLIRSVLQTCALLLVAGLLLSVFVYPFERPFPYVVGLLLGCLLSLSKVVLLERSLERSSEIGEEKQAKNYAHLQAILRYFLTIAVMLSAVFFRQVVGVFGVVLGILSLQPAAYLTNAVLRRHPEYVDQ